jgi:hypothetical protein
MPQQSVQQQHQRQTGFRSQRAQGDRKRRATEEQEHYHTEDMLHTMAKLTLANSQSIRSIEGCLYNMYLIPEAAAPIQEMKRALRGAARLMQTGPYSQQISPTVADSLLALSA